jgi:hypothetical protein
MSDPQTSPGRGNGKRKAVQLEELMDIDASASEAYNAHIMSKITEYQQLNLQDHSLWLTFREDFRNWTEETFSLCSPGKVHKLRDILRNHGVWVQNKIAILVGQSLVGTLLEQEPRVWNLPEALEHLNNGGRFNSGIVNSLLQKIVLSKIPPEHRFPTPHQFPPLEASTPAVPQKRQRCKAPTPIPTQENALELWGHRPRNELEQDLPDMLENLTIDGSSNSGTVISLRKNGLPEIPPGQRLRTPLQLLSLEASTPAVPQKLHCVRAPAPIPTQENALELWGHGPWNEPDYEFIDRDDYDDGFRSGPGNKSRKPLGNLSQVYTETTKYSGEDGNLDYKLVISHELCYKANVSQEAKAKAYPTVLQDQALDHFNNNPNENEKPLPFKQMGSATRVSFQGSEYSRSKLEEWCALTLAEIIKRPQNNDKTATRCLDLLIEELQHLQPNINPDIRREECISTDHLNNKQNKHENLLPLEQISARPSFEGLEFNNKQINYENLFSFEQISARLSFAGREYRRRKLEVWCALALTEAINRQQHNNKTATKFLDLLIEELQHLRFNLNPDFGVAVRWDDYCIAPALAMSS